MRVNYLIILKDYQITRHNSVLIPLPAGLDKLNLIDDDAGKYTLHIFDLRRCPDGQRFANLLMSCCKAAKVALSCVEQEMPFPSALISAHNTVWLGSQRWQQSCRLGGKGEGWVVRASCQVIWIIFPTSAKFTYQICNFACGYRCRCSCSWSRAKVAGIYSQLYVCLSSTPHASPSPTAAACLAAAKDAFGACFWLDSDSTWMKMFARIRGINKCTPCASQFMYVSMYVWCVCVCALASCRLCPCLECLSKALACVWTAIWIMNLRKLRKLFIIDVEHFKSRLFM